jgi:Fic family protein
MFYISSYLEANRDEYVDRLRGLGKPKSWDRWIDFFLRAVVEQAKANASTARANIELYERLKTNLIELTHSRYAVPLLDRLFDQPIFQSSHLSQYKNAKHTHSYANAEKTAQGRHLKTVGKGRERRGEMFAFVELLNLCEQEATLTWV